MAVQVKTLVGDPELVRERRSQLITAAIELFSKRGYHLVTIKDLARVARFSPGLVYQYVHDKQDVLFLALLHIVETNKREIPGVLEKAGNDPLRRLLAIVHKYFRVIAENRHAVVLTYRETKSLRKEHKAELKALELETNRFITDCIRAGIRAGYFRPVNAEVVTYHLVLVAHGWALKHWRLRQVITLDEYIDQSLNFALQALLTPRGRRAYAKWIRETGKLSSPRRGAVTAMK